MTRVLTNQDTTITMTAYSDGTQTDQGTFTIGIVDGNGTEVVAPGTAVTDNSDGTYEYILSAQSDPSFLIATWTESAGQPIYKTHIEVVGGFLFSEAEARAFDAKANGTGRLSSASEYTDAMIAEARDAVTDLLEQWTNRSFFQRYCRVELPGSGSRELMLSDGNARTAAGVPLHRPGRHSDINTVISATVNGSAVTTSNIKVDPLSGALYRTDSTWSRATSSNPRNVTVEYTYGASGNVDGANRIGLLLTLDRLIPSPISDRAVSMTDELGTLRFETPGRFGNVSTIPEVNAWVKSHSVRIPLG